MQAKTAESGGVLFGGINRIKPSIGEAIVMENQQFLQKNWISAVRNFIVRGLSAWEMVDFPGCCGLLASFWSVVFLAVVFWAVRLL